MRWLIRILSILFFILVVLAALAFLGANSQLHDLQFLDWHLAQAKVGTWILVSLVLGILLGLLASAPLVLGLRRQNKRMQKKLSEKQPVSELTS